MFSFLLLTAVVLWIAWSHLQDRQTDRRHATRTTEKIVQRQTLLQRMPESPSAHEALGDALREAGRADEAVRCYQTALDLQARASAAGGGVIGAGIGGAGLEHKLRLTQEEAGRGGVPAPGETMATRQQVCRQCGALNGPQERVCVNCAAQMPVDGFFDTLRHDDMRTNILREAAETTAMFAVVIVALIIAGGMPLEVKGVLGISTAAVLGFRFLKRIGGN